ncbi:hypothetical protein LTS17_012846 [Exophiala oligosperma]
MPEIVAPVRFICGHSLEAQTFSTGGNNNKVAHLAESKKKYPCDDCKATKKWIEQGGKWVKA